VRRADNLTTFMYRLCTDLEAAVSFAFRLTILGGEDVTNRTVNFHIRELLSIDSLI
jgi:hypothetical protein